MYVQPYCITVSATLLCGRFETITKVRALQDQVTFMTDIVSHMKKDKEQATKRVQDMEAALNNLIHKIRVCF